MDQLEYYSPCLYTPCIETRESQFKKKYNLEYNGLNLNRGISSDYTFIYEHLPTNRLFKYSLCSLDWEEMY